MPESILKTRHYKRSWLSAQEIGLETGIAVLVRPECERNRSEVVDQGDGVAVFC